MTESNNSRSERLPTETGPRPCRWCGEPLTGKRASADYCGQVCRKAAFDERARSGRVASVRILKSGLQSITVHVKDGGVKPGDSVRIG